MTPPQLINQICMKQFNVNRIRILFLLCAWKSKKETKIFYGWDEYFYDVGFKCLQELLKIKTCKIFSILLYKEIGWKQDTFLEVQPLEISVTDLMKLVVQDMGEMQIQIVRVDLLLGVNKKNELIKYNK